MAVSKLLNKASDVNVGVYKNKTVLVTGGTGSFGRNFVKFLLTRTEAKKVIIFSRDELKQFHMERELRDPRLRFFIGDVKDLPRLQRAFAGVDIVVHAAALKQVPALEYNPMEAVKTNIIGSQNVIEAALDQKISQALLISTDKAAHPINLYGSTKLCAEKLFAAGNSYSGAVTKFAAVRYGNVLGSRGSIVEALMKGDPTSPVQITDTAMTRFWIDYEQTFQLVSFAFTEMKGGEIFVPKVPSMKLTDLFDVLAGDRPREIIGRRPGEKVHEVLLTEHEASHAVDLGRYFVILPEFHFWDDEQLADYYRRGRKVKAGFSFMSHTNKKKLSPKQLKSLLARSVLS